MSDLAGSLVAGWEEISAAMFQTSGGETGTRLFYFMSCNSHIITHDGINTVYSFVTVCPTLVATENIEL